MARINLLPWRNEVKQQRQKQFNMAATFILLLAVIFVVLLSYMADLTLVNQQQRNQYLQQEISILDKKIVEIVRLKQIKKDLSHRVLLIEQLQNSRNLSTHLLDELAKIISPGVYLNKVARKGDIMWLEGLSESNSHLANMIRNVEKSLWYQNPLLQQINLNSDAPRQLNSFSLRMDIVINTPTEVR
ncbi:MAG: PilN domain-containing protein [Psychrobium sp.]|nr:PilN domain-containing protein [Psychrobium sp.]